MVLNLHNECLEEKFITVFDDTIKAVFSEDMIKTGDCRVFDHMGHFELTYNYLPHNYTICLEHERGFIEIRIVDSENAWAFFTQLTQYHFHIYPTFRNDDIRKAVLLLKNLLEENNFTFYFSKGNKLYSKNAEGIKRIKTWLQDGAKP